MSTFTASTASSELPASPALKQTHGRLRHHDGLSNGTSTSSPKLQSELTALQQHVLFWDRDNDGIIYPWDVYNGFRDLGFSVIFSIGSLLIPLFFSYPTGLAYSWFPDPLFRIYVGSIHKAKHGSDTGIFDVDGHFHADRFDAMFDRWDTSRCGGLSADEMWNMWKKNRLAADMAGWCFGFMEMWTTWLLLQKNGRVWKEDLRGCYDGTLFWRISELAQKREWKQGYGIGDFLGGMMNGGTWRSWEVKKQHKGHRGDNGGSQSGPRLHSSH
ncbi:hypothetical protein Z517_04889 [Fonsecaea pedrosoi CBS 271.37]|uniref:EF-hand domain-containing protein n=1 Tax=Fonsecaea pedrosoi CBS 271.37 TaxID=1442368 RepID=A0A0D2GLP3_9EURO|nr:uncharacterized protein Z517_04889 [Fonsecaea pedrosoi CBS 271.37]KIW81863.1 hypothetical protein Z517_04889 [Fonsecaea pedrosoi CBS 271.37]